MRVRRALRPSPQRTRLSLPKRWEKPSSKGKVDKLNAAAAAAASEKGRGRRRRKRRAVMVVVVAAGAVTRREAMENRLPLGFAGFWCRLGVVRPEVIYAHRWIGRTDKS